MKRCAFLLAALAVFGVASADPSTAFETLFMIDCAGHLRFFPDSALAFSVDISPQLEVYRTVRTGFVEAAQCRCPDASVRELQDRFDPVDNFLRKFLSGPQPPPMPCLDADPDFTRDTWKLIDDMVGPFLNDLLPSSCSYESYVEGSCLAEMPISSELTFQFGLGRCSVSPLPWVSFSCKGTACRMFHPCSTDNDCKGSSLSCKPLYELFDTEDTDLFHLWQRAFVYGDSDVYGACKKPETVLTDLFSRFNYLFPNSPTDTLSVCFPDFEQLGDYFDTVGEKVRSNSISRNGDPCADSWTEGYPPVRVYESGISLQNKNQGDPLLTPWNGILEGGDAVDRYDRISGRHYGILHPPGVGGELGEFIFGQSCDGTGGIGFPDPQDPTLFRVNHVQSIMSALADEMRGIWECRSAKYSGEEGQKLFRRAVELWSPDVWLWMASTHPQQSVAWDPDDVNNFGPNKGPIRAAFFETCYNNPWEKLRSLAVQMPNADVTDLRRFASDVMNQAKTAWLSMLERDDARVGVAQASDECVVLDGRWKSLSTCDYASWTSDGNCSLRFAPPFANSLGDTGLLMFVRTCPNSEFPEFAARCDGPGCKFWRESCSGSCTPPLQCRAMRNSQFIDGDDFGKIYDEDYLANLLWGGVTDTSEPCRMKRSIEDLPEDSPCRDISRWTSDVAALYTSATGVDASGELELCEPDKEMLEQEGDAYGDDGVFKETSPGVWTFFGLKTQAPPSADFDDCVSAPCLNGGTCIDGNYHYTCDCADAFFGENCQTGIVAVAVFKAVVKNKACSVLAQDDYLEFRQRIVDSLNIAKPKLMMRLPHVVVTACREKAESHRMHVEFSVKSPVSKEEITDMLISSIQPDGYFEAPPVEAEPGAAAGESEGMGAGALAGIIVGCVVGVILAVLALVFVIRWAKKSRPSDPSQGEELMIEHHDPNFSYLPQGETGKV